MASMNSVEVIGTERRRPWPDVTELSGNAYIV
jgi:hypothetical protein